MSKEVDIHIKQQYKLLREIGSGAYGHVWQVEERSTKNHYALKKVFDAFRNSIDAQRTFREVQILHQIQHVNIIKLKCVMKSKNMKDLYLLFELMETDLHSLIGSKILKKSHLIYVFYQILKALEYLHSVKLIHRDLKPSNILIDSLCTVKICDFGLVRSLYYLPEELVLSEEIATKWYRAPELLLSSNYSQPVDMWSFGCVVAELLTGKPLFSGKSALSIGNSTLSQFEAILQYTGEVDLQELNAVTPSTVRLIAQAKVKKKPFKHFFKGVDPCFHPLISGVLRFDPRERLTAQEALQLPIFSEMKYQISGMKILRQAIIPSINDNMRVSVNVYRNRIYEDIGRRYLTSRYQIRELTDFENERKVEEKLKVQSLVGKNASMSYSSALLECRQPFAKYRQNNKENHYLVRNRERINRFIKDHKEGKIGKGMRGQGKSRVLKQFGIFKEDKSCNNHKHHSITNAKQSKTKKWKSNQKGQDNIKVQQNNCQLSKQSSYHRAHSNHTAVGVIPRLVSPAGFEGKLKKARLREGVKPKIIGYRCI